MVAIGLFLVLRIIRGSSDEQDADSAPSSTIAPTEAPRGNAPDFSLAPPIIVLGEAGLLPALPATGDVPVAGDPAVGLTSPTVTGPSDTGESVSFGSGGSPTIVVMVTAADNVDGTIATASASLDSDGNISDARAILVVSGTAPEAKDWLEASGWPGVAIVDTSGSELLDSFGVSLTPHVVAIDDTGRVAARAAGVLNESNLRLLALSAIVGAQATESAASTTTAGADTTSTTVSPRAGTLYSTFAKIREEPHIDSPEVTTLVDQEGLDIDVLTANQRGWYLIRAGTIEGWIFGTFVLPPDAGLHVAITRGGDRAVLLDELGNESTEVNQSGPKVLVIDTSGDLWEVLLPNGGTAFVDPAVMRLVN